MGRGDRIVEVIYNKEIEPSVVVIVDPPCGNGPRLAPSGKTAADSRFLGHITEGPVSVVVKELIAIESGHIQIHKSIIVVIARGHAHCVADAGQACFLGNIGKGSVSVIAKEPVVETGIALLQRWNFCPVRKEDVQEPIIVVVEQRNAAGHGLDRVALRTDTVLQYKIDLRWANCVFEEDGRIRGLARAGSVLPRTVKRHSRA